MQAKVPQNVDLEDRVVGSLTLRQFLIMLSAFLIVLFLNYTLKGPLRILFFLISILVIIVAGAFAFLRPTEQHLEVLAAAGIRMFSKPRKMVWKKLNDMPQNVKKANESPAKKKERHKRGLVEVRSDFEKLAHVVDSGAFNDVENKDRMAMTRVQATEENILEDVYDKNTEPKSDLDKEIMEMVQERKQAKDPLVAELASVSPAKKFEYPQISTLPNNFINEVK